MASRQHRAFFKQSRSPFLLSDMFCFLSLFDSKKNPAITSQSIHFKDEESEKSKRQVTCPEYQGYSVIRTCLGPSPIVNQLIYQFLLT